MQNLDRYFKHLLTILTFSFIPLLAFGYDFTSLSSNLSQSFRRGKLSTEETRLALIFLVTDKPKIQKQFNIVKLKRDLANELVQHYNMTDPLIVAQILKINALKYEDLQAQKDLIKKVGMKAEASHLALAHFQFQQEKLILDFQLVDINGDKKEHIQIVIPPAKLLSDPDPKPKSSVRNAASTNERPPVKDSVKNLFSNYQAPQSNSQLNDSWVYFAPTAFLNPDTYFIELSFWPKDFANTDFPLVQARYDFTVKKYFNIGSLSYGNEEGEYHSHYIYSKVKLFDAPLATIAIGIKKRIVWNSDNTEFTSDSEVIDEKNLSRNELTLQGISSGWLEPLGLLWNFYLDNQNVGLGGKILLTSEIKLIVDSVYHYYENAHVTGDQAFGIQFNNLSGGVSTFSYQSSNEQTRLSLGFSW
ncbi:MAG: hypothetical protein GY786_08780 [Proteobacteria bacterium]|nr:hypothetical protein [Pseudomonadota bacterium]